MIYLYFIAAYGIPLSMMAFAWYREPKKSGGNTGVRL